jgi:hypothetical protein
VTVATDVGLPAQTLAQTLAQTTAQTLAHTARNAPFTGLAFATVRALTNCKA